MNPILNIPNYTVELWNINNVYVMDISDIITSSLRINLKLNDVEQLDFGIDLIQYEKKCASINLNPRNVMNPYQTEVKIRRNDVYMLGTQVVQTQVNFNNESQPTLQVRCTGYLNLFKDRYITAQYGTNFTYSEIAKAIIMDSQKGSNLIKNWGFEGNLNGWFFSTAGARNADSQSGKWSVSITAASGDRVARYDTDRVYSGTSYYFECWIKKATTGDTVSLNLGGTATTYSITSTASTAWQKVTTTFTAPAGVTSLRIISNNNFYLDNVVLRDPLDNPTNYNFSITLGDDFATSTQSSGRERDYDTQNVKDALINLTKLENDNFDFKITHDKKLNLYQRIGSNKPETELVYPQNINSMTIIRDASTLANKVIGMGSGIGDERIEASSFDLDSSAAFRVRERVDIYNDISTLSVLQANVRGQVSIYKDIYTVPSLALVDANIDPTEVIVGDSIYIRVDDSTYVDDINGLYRIIEMNIEIDKDSREKISLGVI